MTDLEDLLVEYYKTKQYCTWEDFQLKHLNPIKKELVTNTINSMSELQKEIKILNTEKKSIEKKISSMKVKLEKQSKIYKEYIKGCCVYCGVLLTYSGNYCTKE